MSAPNMDNRIPVQGTRLDRKFRLSLQEKELRPDTESSKTRRNTISTYTKPKKKSKAPPNPPIIEDEDDVSENIQNIDTITMENEIQPTATAPKIIRQPSVVSRNSDGSKTSRTTFAYDNMAYEGNLKRSGSTATSTSKAPSLQSLDIYKEQYCCFSKRTKCEKSLLITVTVLVIIIIVLIIVIVVLAKHIHDPSSLSILSRL